MSIGRSLLSGTLLSILGGKKEVAKCGLHPLIHTFALATMALHAGTGQKVRECGLKYVIYSPRKRVGEFI